MQLEAVKAKLGKLVNEIGEQNTIFVDRFAEPQKQNKNADGMILTEESTD